VCPSKSFLFAKTCFRPHQYHKGRKSEDERGWVSRTTEVSRVELAALLSQVRKYPDRQSLLRICISSRVREREAEEGSGRTRWLRRLDNIVPTLNGTAVVLQYLIHTIRCVRSMEWGRRDIPHSLIVCSRYIMSGNPSSTQREDSPRSLSSLYPSLPVSHFIPPNKRAQRTFPQIESPTSSESGGSVSPSSSLQSEETHTVGIESDVKSPPVSACTRLVCEAEDEHATRMGRREGYFAAVLQSYEADLELTGEEE
jgi:hypothetical protein